MSGLNLISTYCSDSESATTDDEDQAKRTLPLPPSIASWRGVPHHEEVQNEPALHNGRNRTFDHVRGNWATLIYVEFVPSDALWSWMHSVRQNTFNQESFLLDQLHRTRSFSLELMDVAVYLNEEKSRTFLAIRCQDTSGTLNHFTKDLDKLLGEYNLPPFYEGASHHVSFAWCLGNQEEYLQNLLPSISASFSKLIATNAKDNHIHVNKLLCKIGNKLYAFPLR